MNSLVMAEVGFGLLLQFQDQYGKMALSMTVVGVSLPGSESWSAIYSF